VLFLFERFNSFHDFLILNYYNKVYSMSKYGVRYVGSGKGREGEGKLYSQTLADRPAIYSSLYTTKYT
jgi:hypothetical protein